MESNVIVSCPYNESHRIALSKLMQHITKCKATAKTDNMVACPLDKSHIVHAKKLKEHLESCSHLGDLVVDINPSKTEQPLPTLIGNIESEENWDEEPEVPSYNAIKLSAEKKVLRNISGLSKAKRVAFRENERQRLANIRECDSIETNKPSTSKHKVLGVSVCPPQFALKSESAKTAKTSKVQKPVADLSEDTFCTTFPSVCDSSVQTLDSSFKDSESFYSPKLHNELLSGRNIEKDNKYENDMMSKKFTHQEPCARDSATEIVGNNFLTFDQKLETTCVDEPEKILEAFRNENRSFASTSTAHVSNEPSEKNKLLNLFKNPEYLKKIHQSLKDETVSDREKTVDSNGTEWDFHKFNERFAYLTDIQNAAAEESARLLSQLNNLKLRDTKN